MAERRDVAIGFQGGQVLSVRVDDGALEGLTRALGGDRLWHDLTTEDGTVQIRLDKVVYLNVAGHEHRVGFG
jgi:hypothetical protein